MDFFKMIGKYFITAPLTDYICYAFMLLVAFWSKNKYYKQRDLLVNSIAAIGMVGTFLGICVALSNFDSTNVADSLPQLLKGMRTAFYTSLIGTGVSVALKIIYGLWGTKQDPIEKEFFDANKSFKENNISLIFTNKAILEAIKEQTLEIKALKNTNLNKFTDILDRLTTNGLIIEGINSNINCSLYDIKKIIIDTNNKLLNLQDEFKTFKQKMAQENNQAFIEALGKCVKTLNKEMMEQLGENFNKFNEGMLRLIRWQENYIEIIKQTEDNQSKIANTFTVIENKLIKASESVAILGEKSEKIISVCTNVSSIVYNLNNITEKANNSEVNLRETISGITSITNDLIEFKDILGNVIKNTADANEIFNITVLNSKQEIANIQEELARYYNGTTETHSQFLDILRKEFAQTSQNINELNNNLRKQCETIVINTATGIELTNKKLGEHLNKHIDNIENELGKALTSSLISLGEELASLSNKFVKDYTPLTDKLRDVVRIAEKVR